MSRKMLLAVLGFAVFTVLPLLTSSDEVRAQSAPAVSRNEDALVCPVGPAMMTGLQVQNVGTSNATIAVNYYNPNGSSAGSDAFMVQGPGSTSTMLPSGFIGAAVVSSDTGQVAAVVTSYGGDTANSPFSAFRCPQGFPGSGLVGPVEDNKQPIYNQNVAGSSTEVTNWFYDQSGGQSTKSYTAKLNPNQMKKTNAKKAGGKKGGTPGTILSYGDFFRAVYAYTLLASQASDEPPDHVGGVDFGSAADVGYLSIPPAAPGRAATGTINILSHFSGDQDVVLTFFDDQGSPTETITGTLPGQGVYQHSATITSTGSSSLIYRGSGLSGNWTHQQSSGDGIRATLRSGNWPAAKPTDVLTKRGYAFGASSTQQAKVSVVLQNVGTKKVKVKVRIFNGDTGKKVQGGTVNIEAGGVGTLPFKKRARGENLYAEISVKGKGGAVVGSLMRSYQGDVDFYPAVPR